MKSSDERWVARGIVAAVIVLNAILLAPELTIGRVDLNDSVFHFSIADDIVNRVAHGRPALEFWMPEWSFGYPVLRVYQPLGAWLLALVQLGTGQQFPLDATLAFLRWFLLAIFPLSVYAACRLIGFRPLTAAATAVITPLIASPNLYGLEYGSYLWRGNGLYTQLVAMHFFVFAIGTGCRAIRRGRGVTLAGLLLALTFLAHLIYGYMAAVTITLVVFFPDSESPWRKRVVRYVWIGLLSFGLTAFQLLPMLHDGAFINRSRWEPVWKWDSFGLKQVAVLVATGEIVDAQRLPVVAALALAGALYAWRKRRQPDDDRFPLLFALAGAVLWLFFFAGPETWGPLLRILGVGDEVQAHRFIGGLHFFLIVLGGIGLERIVSIPFRHRWRFAALLSLVIAAALLTFPILDRVEYVSLDEKWGRENLALYEQHRSDIDASLTLMKDRGGRAYPGLAATWGNQFKVGYVPFHAFMSRAHVPAVAFLYHAMSLPSDIMVRFDETRPEHYRLFDIRTAVSEAGRKLPPFLTPLQRNGAFQLYNAPSTSSFDLVEVPFSIYADRQTFYDVNDAWLQSAWVGGREHLLIDYESASSTLPRLPSVTLLSRMPMSRVLGNVVKESVSDDAYDAAVDAKAGCYLMLKSTYHPNWVATIDGRDANVVMVTPGFAAVRVPAGRHEVQFRYDHGGTKPLLLLLAFPLLIGSFIAERRGFVVRAEERVEPLHATWSPAWLLGLLILPCLAPLLGRAGISGHDALEYLPRLVEFHENIRHWILLPRWAADLSAGQGQPLFLLNPPFFYYLADIFHILGFSFVRAINIAVALVIIASAASMFLLARYWFGRSGAMLAAVAYVYAPYFLVDLDVRTAFAELSAFPFYPLAFYGFARYADERRSRDLALGIAGYAAIWFAHTPSAVLFSPLLGAFLIYLAWEKRSVSLFVMEAAGIAVALAISAVVWIPGLVDASQTNSHRLTEGALQYSNHFVYPRQLFSTMWGYGLSVAGDQDGMPFGLGWPHLLIAGAAAFVIFRSDDAARRRWLIFFATATFAVCYFVTPRSHAVWDAIPQLHYVAFPWRLLADSAFCLALLVGAAAWAIERLPAERRGFAFAALIAIVVLCNVPHARPSSNLSIDPVQWTPRQIAARNVVAATFDTFEPRWVEARPVYNGQTIAVNRGAASVAIGDRTPEHFVATVRASSESDLELPIAYFPGWRVTVDGTENPVDSPSETGRMRLTVVPGTHRIEARYEATASRITADVVSLIGLLILFALPFVGMRSAYDSRGR